MNRPRLSDSLWLLGLLVCFFSALPQSSASPRNEQATAAPSQASTPSVAKPADTEVWEPEPKIVTPGAACGAPPSDAIVLFDGKNLDEWVSAKDKSPAQWTVADGVM